MEDEPFDVDALQREVALQGEVARALIAAAAAGEAFARDRASALRQLDAAIAHLRVARDLLAEDHVRRPGSFPR